MIVTLCTGSVFGSRRATIAWPDSWYAVLRRSSSGMTIERRSAPMMILSLARSKSSMSTRRLFSRAANSAASFTRLARSAPEKPGVPRAMMSGLTSGASGTLRMCTLQDLLAAADVGQRHDDLAVEAARAQQRRIEHVGTVGRGDDDHAHRRLEAVHLDQQLVQRLLALVVAAAEAGAALAADRVDLVDEHDARRVLLRLLEHVAHARRADADEHLDEVGARDREERHLRFARDGAREQRLAGAGRADHQHAARDAPAELLELGRIAQEVDQLGDFFLRLLAARDVGEGDGVGRLVQHARARLAEARTRRRARRPASGA